MREVIKRNKEMKKKQYVFLLVFMLPFLGAGLDNEFVSHTKSSAPDQSRFEMFQSSLFAKFTFKLDKYTGETFYMALAENAELTWQGIKRTDIGGDITISNQVNYQVFMSGIAAKHTYLINVNSGRTWQLCEVSGEGSLRWEPIKTTDEINKAIAEKRALDAEKKALKDKEWQKLMEIEAKKPKGTSGYFPLESSSKVKNLHLPDNTLVYYQGVPYITHDQHGKKLEYGFGIRQGITSSNSPNGLGPYEWKLDPITGDFPFANDKDVQEFLKANPKGSFRNPYISSEEIKKLNLSDEITVFIRKKDGKVIQVITSSNSLNGVKLPELEYGVKLSEWE